MHVPGLAPLKGDSALFAQEMVVKFCPETLSPSSMQLEVQELGNMLIAVNGHCGTRGQQLASDVKGAADCLPLLPIRLMNNLGVKSYMPPPNKFTP